MISASVTALVSTGPATLNLEPPNSLRNVGRRGRSW
jgi:hypothetical protein